MTKGIKTTKSTKRIHDRAPDAEPATPYLDLACEAVLEDMTREQVIAQLVSRIKRDQGYLAYRKASGRKTRYDDQVTSDLRALALAAVLLEERAMPLTRPYSQLQHVASPYTVTEVVAEKEEFPAVGDFKDGPGPVRRTEFHQRARSNVK